MARKLAFADSLVDGAVGGRLLGGSMRSRGMANRTDKAARASGLRQALVIIAGVSVSSISQVGASVGALEAQSPWLSESVN